MLCYLFHKECTKEEEKRKIISLVWHMKTFLSLLQYTLPAFYLQDTILSVLNTDLQIPELIMLPSYIQLDASDKQHGGGTSQGIRFLTVN